MRFFASMGTLAIASLTLGAHAGIIDITEIRTGSGNAEYIELKGPPGQSLGGFAIVIIGDGTSTTSGTGAPPTRSGVVEWLYRFAPTDVIGPNGYLVLRNPGQNPANAADTSGAFPFAIPAGATDRPWGYQASGLAADTQIESPDNQTYLLVTGYTGTDTFQTRAPNQGADGQDLDTNDDGILDITPWTAIIDGVVFKESSGGVPGSGQEWWYFPTTCGPYITRQIVPATSGTIVAGWDFQTTTNTNAGTAAAAQPNTPKLFRSNAGVGTMYLDGTNGSSNWAQATELNAFTGTNLNATGTGTGGNGLDPATTPTSSLALQAGGTGTPGNGKSFTLKFPMVGISGLNISYATRTSGATTGFTNHAWAWSTDGSSWTDIDAVTTFTTSFAVKTLAPLNALNGVTDAYLRCTVTGATSTTSNNRFDNIVLLSNPVTNNTIVTSYLGPIHGYKTSTGAWAIGVASTTTGSRDTPGADNVDPTTYTCGATGSGDCSVAHDNPYCADSCCCTQVCVADPFCCQVRWDAVCAAAAANCNGNCGGGCQTDLNAALARRGGPRPRRLIPPARSPVPAGPPPVPGPRCFSVRADAARGAHAYRGCVIAALSAAMIAAATLVQTPAAPPPGGAPPTPAPPASGPATFSTISGRPPELPARRVEPRIWEIAFEADIWAPQTPGAKGAPLNFGGVVAWMPLVLQSTYSAMDAQSIRAETWVDGKRVAVPVASLQMRQGLSQGMSAVGIQMPPAGVQGIKWKVSWKVQCWSPVVDERAAAAITWPAEWPAEAQESLQAAPGFEVGHPDMKAFVDRATGGKLRSVTPWIAAKELVRATCTTFRGLDEDGVRVENGFPRGLVFNGAHAAMSAGTGSGPDLVASCVTVLRTAGIPARAVLGAAEVMNSSGTNSRARLTCWAELWLPGAGWVPFSPVDLVGSIRGGLNVERPWKNFGTWDGLNESIPLCYGWALPMQGCHSLPYPAGYVLNARIAPDDIAQMRDRVTIQILGRGRGRD